MTSILQDLIDPELLAQEPRIVVQQATELMRHRAVSDTTSRFPRSKTLGKARSLLEFYELVRQAVDNYEKRASVPEKLKVIFTEEEPDAESETETVTFSLVKRQPGGFGQGAPFESDVRNLRPIIREDIEDPENPTYRKIILGYWHDNIVRFTCWARTNKAANKRAMWFENLMEEYTWWLCASGVSRVIYWGQGPDLTTTINNNKWYGRAIDFYIKTETIRTFSEKSLEEILIKLAVYEK